MRFNFIQPVVIVLAPAVFGTAALAQDFYGTADISLGYTDVTDNGNPEGWSSGVAVAGFAGKSFGQGLFVEGDLRLQLFDTQTSSNDSLNDSQLIALRFGRDWGNSTGEAILGYTSANTDEGTTARGFLAVAGSHSLSQQLTVTGLLGYLDGTEGNDDDGLDGFSEMWHVSVGANYQINDRLGIWGNVLHGEGIMDDDVPRIETGRITEVGLGLDYQFANPALTGYMGVSYGDYFQGAPENENATEARVNLGIVWTFGGSSERSTRSRPALPNYENWLATSAGVLE